MARSADAPAYFKGMARSLPLLNLSDDDLPLGAAAALPCILDLDPPALQAVITELGEPPYRARQLYRALHARLVGSWDEMTDLPTRLRSALSERYRLQSGELVVQAVSR